MTTKSNGKTPEVHNGSLTKMSRKDSPWHIDPEMLRFKIHFFLFIGAQAAAIPYIIVFATERLGLAATSVGVVLTIQMILFIVFKPLTGYIADYFNRLKVIICILALINASGYLLLMTIPKQSTTTPVSGSHFGESDFCLKSLHWLGDSNFTETENPNETCSVCLLNLDCFLNVFEKYDLDNEIIKNFFPGKDSLDKNGQIPVILLQRNCTIHLILCNDYHLSLRNCSMKLVETSLLQGSDCNRRIGGNHLCNTIMCKDAIHIPKTSQEQNLTESGHDSADVKPLSSQETTSDFLTVHFWLFAIIFSMSSVTANATFTLSDTACCESIQKSGAEFGRQRLWGAIGWGAIAPLAGFLNDYTHSFLASYILMAVMMILFLWNLFKLDIVKPHFSQNILHDVGTVFRSREFLCFELVILMNGVALGMIWFYLVLFLTSIGGSELLCGLALTVQSFGGSIPFMFYSDWIIRKIGHFNVLNIALFTNVIRFLWYSYLQNPWWVLPVEITHGITYGLYYTALASYGKLSAKPGTEATTQAILFSTNEGIGCGIGCIFAGIAFDKFGGHKTFFITGVFSGCGLIISLILFFFVVGKQNKTALITQPQVDDPSNNSNRINRLDVDDSSNSSDRITRLPVEDSTNDSNRITQPQVNDPSNNSNRIHRLPVDGSSNSSTKMVDSQEGDFTKNSYQINELPSGDIWNNLNRSTEKLVDKPLNDSNQISNCQVNNISHKLIGIDQLLEDDASNNSI